MMDLFAGIAARDAGIARAEMGSKDFIRMARTEGRRLSLTNGSVTSDHLRVWASDHGIKPNHKNAWGAIFKGENWVIIGRCQSKKEANHARWIHVWRYERKGLELPL